MVSMPDLALLRPVCASVTADVVAASLNRARLWLFGANVIDDVGATYPEAAVASFETAESV